MTVLLILLDKLKFEEHFGKWEEWQGACGKCRRRIRKNWKIGGFKVAFFAYL